MKGKKVIDVTDGVARLKCTSCNEHTSIPVKPQEDHDRKFKCPCGIIYDILFNHRECLREHAVEISGSINVNGRVASINLINYSNKDIGFKVIGKCLMEIGDVFTFNGRGRNSQFNGYKFIVRRVDGKRIGAQFADGKVLSPMQRQIASNK